MPNYDDGPPPTPAQQVAATERFAHMHRQLVEQVPPLDGYGYPPPDYQEED